MGFCAAGKCSVLSSQCPAITVTTHKLARIIWALVVSGQPYDETKAFDTTPAATARRLKNLQNQALTLNMKLVPV